VRLQDPARLDVRGTLECGSDVEIDVNCVFEGRVQLADGARIGANCVIANCTIERGAVIQAFTHIDGEKAGVTVGENARVGPFARLRPGAQLGAEVHIGNFVEVKNATLAAAGLPVAEDRRAPIEIMRQVQIVAGSLVLAGVLLGAFVAPGFYGLAGFVGSGLVFAGASGTCAMANILRRMPWNRPAMA
jgi:UDP-3-O-[3-hydroxymyristoyl] glucosamine N-acyltransferase